MPLFKTFNFNNFLNKTKKILREEIIYYDIIKKVYFPLLLLMIINLYGEENNYKNILISIGIASAIVYFPGNLIGKSFGLIQINRTQIFKNEFIYSIFLNLVGIIFFVLFFFYGFEHIANFYLQDKNIIFKFIFIIFLILGIFHYLSEIYVPFAIKSNNSNIILYTYLVANFFLLIIFIFTHIYNLEFKWFFSLVALSFSLSQSVSIYKLNVIWYRLLY